MSTTPYLSSGGKVARSQSSEPVLCASCRAASSKSSSKTPLWWEMMKHSQKRNSIEQLWRWLKKKNNYTTFRKKSMSHHEDHILVKTSPESSCSNPLPQKKSGFVIDPLAYLSDRGRASPACQEPTKEGSQWTTRSAASTSKHRCRTMAVARLPTKQFCLSLR